MSDNKRLYLSKGKFALVSIQDYEAVSKHKWSLHPGDRVGKLFYASRSENGKVIKLHREIMNAQKGEFVDHIDGNGLNNVRENLRLVSHKENMANQRKRAGKSKYRGVYFNKSHGKWRAQIQIEGKRTYLGSFASEIEAAKAFNDACLKFYNGKGELNNV